MPALSLGTNQKRLLIGPLVEPSCSCSGSTLIVSITPPCITRGANKDLKNLPDSFAGSRVPGLRAFDSNHLLGPFWNCLPFPFISCRAETLADSRTRISARSAEAVACPPLHHYS